MKSTRPLQGSVSRADLLRALALYDRNSLTLDETAHVWHGYLKREPEEQPASGDPQLMWSAIQTTSHSREGSVLPLKLPYLWAVTKMTTSEPQTVSKRVEAGNPMTEDDARAKGEPLSLHRDLLSWARLSPALLKPLRQPRPGELDIARLVDQWARRERDSRWPRKMVARLPDKLVVYLDFSERLWPYRSDMHKLCRRLLALCGRDALSLRVVLNGPGGGWIDWLAAQSDKHKPVLQDDHPCSPDKPLLIVGDLGAYSHIETQEGWGQFIDRLQGRNVRPLALCPVGPERMNLLVYEKLPVLRWSPDAAMRFSRHNRHPASTEDGLNALLAMIAMTRRVDPPLLRAFRALNPHSPLNAGLEAAVWRHPDVLADGDCIIRKEAEATHLRRFNEFSSHLQQQVFDLRQQHHCHFRAGLNHEENLWFNAHADEETRKILTPYVDKAVDYARKMLGSVEKNTDDAPKWRRLARLWVERADDALAKSQSDLFQALAEAVYKGEKLPETPRWVELPPVGIQRDCWLVQDFGGNTLKLQTSPPQQRQGYLAGPFNVAAIDVMTAHGKKSRLPIPDSEALTLLDVEATSSDELHLGGVGYSCTIQKVEKQGWIESWGRGRDGSFAVIPNPWGQCVALNVNQTQHLIFEGTISESIALYRRDHDKLITALHLDALGPLAALTVNNQTQSFRYLPPGQFLMGSAEDEAERYSDEGPQHLVTLTEGLWLADTACTQGLWQAVMGNNPSHFKPDLSLPAASLSNPSNGGDADLPVKQVSWDDVREFLKELQVVLPKGVEAVLPTEAEWEYACRAGTTTPFSFGTNISTEQVNYDGNFPYAGGAKGQYREKTVSVKALPANPWGLYQMHGNVWEWCADGMRDYTTENATDPSGARDGGSFVVRGGSWLRDARYARSARRDRRLRDRRSDNLGFRFALRSRAQEGVGGSGRSPEETRDVSGFKAAKAASGRGGTPRPDNSILASVKELLTGRGRKK